MKLVKVEILGLVTTAQYGTLTTGQILTTNEAFAKHLVEDCSAAKYVVELLTAEQAAAEQAAAEQAAKQATNSKKK